MTLDEHKITRIESFTFRREFPRYMGNNAKVGPHGKTGIEKIRRIHSNQGAIGIGRSSAPDESIYCFIGCSVGDLFDPAIGTVVEAGFLDAPLHDLAGQILEQPVWKMVGARAGNSIEVYTGGIYFDDLDPQDSPRGIDAVLEACQQDFNAGHAHFKLKIGRGFKFMETARGDQRDIDITRAVRDAFPNSKILIDANDGYTLERFRNYFEVVSDCEIYWVEEPFLETVYDLKALRAFLKDISPQTLIADFENRNGRNEKPPSPFGRWRADHLEELYKLGCDGLIDVALMDVGSMGLTAWRKVMPLLEANGIKGSPHAWDAPLKTIYAAQVNCGLGNGEIVEGVPGFVQGVDTSAYTLKNGILTLPNLPGFGMSIDESQVLEYSDTHSRIKC